MIPRCWECGGQLPAQFLAVLATLPGYSLTFIICGEACRAQVTREALAQGAACETLSGRALWDALAPPWTFDAVVESPAVGVAAIYFKPVEAGNDTAS
jgi:hypothetical protein